MRRAANIPSPTNPTAIDVGSPDAPINRKQPPHRAAGMPMRANAMMSPVLGPGERGLTVVFPCPHTEQ